MTKKEKMVIVRGVVEGADFPERDEVLEMAGLSPSHIKKAVKECCN